MENHPTETMDNYGESLNRNCGELWRITQQKPWRTMENHPTETMENYGESPNRNYGELWRITQQKPIENQIKRRKLNWIGHTLRKEIGAIEKTALDWNPQEYRRRGRPRRMWRRTIEDEIRGTGKTWNEVKRIAGDRNAWKLFMDALCSTRSKRT